MGTWDGRLHSLPHPLFDKRVACHTPMRDKKKRAAAALAYSRKTCVAKFRTGGFLSRLFVWFFFSPLNLEETCCLCRVCAGHISTELATLPREEGLLLSRAGEEGKRRKIHKQCNPTPSGLTFQPSKEGDAT